MENIKELSVLLESMIDILGRILTLENKKTEVLQTGSVEDLNELMNTEQALVMECSAAEKQRNSICSGLQVETISELSKKYPESDTSLAPLHNKLKELVEEIRKTSSVNMKLIDVRLNIIKFMTNQLGISDDNVTYRKNAGTANTVR